MKLKPPVKITDIADLINAKCLGNTSMMVTGINEIHKVERGDLTFVDHPKYYNRALHSAADIILIDKEVEIPEGKAILLSDDPFRDYNFLTQKFAPFKPAEIAIAKEAVIGEGTIIQPNVFIGHNVKIGNNCLVHANVTIGNDTIIGNNVIIHSNTSIGSDAFYYKTRKVDGQPSYEKMHSCGRTVIEDDVEIGACCTIDRGVSGDTIIGKGSKLDNQIHVGHGVEIGKNCLFAAQVGIGGKTIIEDNVIMWGQVGITKDIRIGTGAVILSQSGIDKSIEGGKVYFGSPADEARKKWRELAVLRNLPEVWNKIRGL